MKKCALRSCVPRVKISHVNFHMRNFTWKLSYANIFICEISCGIFHAKFLMWIFIRGIKVCGRSLMRDFSCEFSHSKFSHSTFYKRLFAWNISHGKSILCEKSHLNTQKLCLKDSHVHLYMSLLKCEMSGVIFHIWKSPVTSTRGFGTYHVNHLGNTMTFSVRAPIL